MLFIFVRSPMVFLCNCIYLHMFIGPWLTKMTADSNAGALDAGLDAALSFADLGEPSITLNHIDKLLMNIVDKSFPAKTSTATKGPCTHF